jgi:hypothetical protein
MSDLTRRPGGRPTRRAREQRAFQLVVTSGVAGAVFVLTAILAIVGVVGWGLPILALVVAAIAGLLFRRTVGG